MPVAMAYIIAQAARIAAKNASQAVLRTSPCIQSSVLRSRLDRMNVRQLNARQILNVGQMKNPADLSARIASDVRASIMAGRLIVGDRLPSEAELAEQFGVSRTPLREAFQSLAASGLLTLVARRGAFIRHPDFVELVEMFEVMAELEAMCGFRAARRVTERQMADIAKTIEACEAAITHGDFDEYYRENEKFHHLLYEASGNSFLAREAARLHKRLIYIDADDRALRQLMRIQIPDGVKISIQIQSK